MWRVGRWAKRSRNYNGKYTKYKKGDVYFKDLNMDAELYVEMVKELLRPRIAELRQKYFDVQNGTDEYDITIQHDGAPGHRADGIEEHLDDILQPVRAKMNRQPPKSPCTNLNDACVFHSISSIVAQIDYHTKEQLHVAVTQAFQDLQVETLEMEWACKSITMRRLIDHRGAHIAATHAAHLRKARGKGGAVGRRQLWAAVDAYVSQAHHPAAQCRCCTPGK
jgi:hypothetical protein